MLEGSTTFMKSEKEMTRLSILLPTEKYLNFKEVASKVYKFNRGYTSNAHKKAIDDFIVNNTQNIEAIENYEPALKIAKIKYPYITEEGELKVLIIKEMMCEFINKNKIS
jgi:hypothetical protein